MYSGNVVDSDDGHTDYRDGEGGDDHVYIHPGDSTNGGSGSNGVFYY